MTNSSQYSPAESSPSAASDEYGSPLAGLLSSPGQDTSKPPHGTDGRPSPSATVETFRAPDIVLVDYSQPLAPIESSPSAADAGEDLEGEDYFEYWEAPTSPSLSSSAHDYIAPYDSPELRQHSNPDFLSPDAPDEGDDAPLEDPDQAPEHFYKPVDKVPNADNQSPESAAPTANSPTTQDPPSYNSPSPSPSYDSPSPSPSYTPESPSPSYESPSPTPSYSPPAPPKSSYSQETASSNSGDRPRRRHSSEYVGKAPVFSEGPRTPDIWEMFNAEWGQKVRRRAGR